MDRAPRVERGRSAGIDGQGLDELLLQTRAGSGPGAAGVCGLEDTAGAHSDRTTDQDAPRPGVERRQGSWDRWPGSRWKRPSPELAAAQVPPELVDLKTPLLVPA